VAPSSPFHREISSRLEALKQGKDALDAWQSGAQMSRDEAVAFALDDAEVSAGRNAG
jgi:hypothetical protein